MFNLKIVKQRPFWLPTRVPMMGGGATRKQAPASLQQLARRFAEIISTTSLGSTIPAYLAKGTGPKDEFAKGLIKFIKILSAREEKAKALAVIEIGVEAAANPSYGLPILVIYSDLLRKLGETQKSQAVINQIESTFKAGHSGTLACQAIGALVEIGRGETADRIVYDIIIRTPESAASWKHFAAEHALPRSLEAIGSSAKAEKARQAAEQEELQQLEVERRFAAAVAGLEDGDEYVRRGNLWEYLLLSPHLGNDPRALSPLAKELRLWLTKSGDELSDAAFFFGEFSHRDWFARLIDAIVRLDPDTADRIIAGRLAKKHSLVTYLTPIIEKHPLPGSAKILARYQAEQAVREALQEEMVKIAQTITNKIARATDIGKIESFSTEAGSEDYYGSISLPGGLGLSQTLRIEQKLLPVMAIKIGEGESIAEINERINTLNFLVHHEVSHAIQKRQAIPQPSLPNLEGFDQNSVEHHANEMLVDKLAFETARKIYVYAEEAVTSAAERERIAIGAHLTLSKIIIRNQEQEAHTLSQECLARFIAVLRESATSEVITPATKLELIELAEAFVTWITVNEKETRPEKLERLIEAYREIFRSTQLPL